MPCPPRTLRTCILTLGLALAEAARPAPVANPDSGFTVAEDGVLSAAGVSVLNATFNAPAATPFGPTWKVLTGLTNGTGGPVLGYPVDGASVDWKQAAFNPATSTPGGAWVDASAPMVGPTATDIAFYAASSPTVVFPGGPQVTTYLLRNTLTLSAEQAAIANWSVTYLVDDGCVVHINGTRAFALNMPTGAVTTTTFAAASGEEAQLTTVPVDLTGLLQAGVNTIAIELHQAGTLSDVGFFMQWSPVVDTTGGFAYADDAFGTATPDRSSGSNLSSDGLNGASGGLHVSCFGPPPLNSISNTPFINLSGAWSRTFDIASAGNYTLFFRHRLLSAFGFEPTEYQTTVADLDGTRLGSSWPLVSASVPAVTALHRFVGDGNTGANMDSGWLIYSNSVFLTAGPHTLKLGLFVNHANVNNKIADAYFDDVTISSGGGGGGGTVLANDTGAPPLTAVKVTDPAHGSVTLGSDGSFTYTPAADYFGPDSFTYRAVDGTGTSTPATVSITVTPVNDTPVARADAYTTPEDTPLTVAAPGVIGNDTDADTDTLTATVRAPPANGSLTLAANGGFTYTPNLNFTGVDSFTYRVNDGTVNSADQTVQITVTPVNDRPVAAADAYRTSLNLPLHVTLAVASNQTPVEVVLVAPGVTVPLGDPAESTLPVWRYLDNGTNQGTAWRDPAFDDSGWSSGLAELGYGDTSDGRPERTVVGYGPNVNARYATTYFRTRFQVEDKSTHSNLRLRLLRDDAAAIYLNGVEIYRDITLPADPAYNAYATAAVAGAEEIGLVDKTAALNAGAIANLVEGENVLAVEIHQAAGTSSDVSFDLELKTDRLPFAGVLANDSDPEGSALTAILLATPTNGTVSLFTDGTFSYFPANGVFGTDRFTYLASDGGLSATGTVSITIDSGLNSPPVAVADAHPSVQEDSPYSITAPGVLGNDSDPDLDALSAVLVSTVSHGSLSLSSNGGFTYTPALNYSGPDTFTYRALDARGKTSASAQVSLTVQPVNDAPVAVADSYGADPGATLVVAPGEGVLVNDTDVDSASLTAVLVTPPASGSLNLATDGSFTFTPAPGFSGNLSFTYRANDGGLNSVAAATVTLRVNGRPVAGPDAYAVAEEGSLAVPAGSGVLANDTDPELAPLTAALVSPPAHGALSLAANGSFTYTPAANHSGSDTFTYTASDGVRVSLPATVTFSVLPLPDPPVAVADAYLAAPDQTLVVAADGVLGNDSDPDGDPLTAELVETTANGTLTFSPDGAFTYLPAPGFSGTDTFAYRARDPSHFSAAVTVTLRVDTPGGDLVINEIMYRAGTTYPEPLNREFFELHNRGGAPVDLTGWTVGAGVSYAFPSGRVVAPGAYLVVAADVAAFQAAYPGVTNVVGGWTGTLSNSGETLRLVDAGGHDRDEVFYASEGDWAQRVRETTFNGWAWSTLADGGGRSLELVNAALDNDCGQNWTPSSTIGGSPGRANDQAGTIAPMIRKVSHSPAVPTSADSVILSCELTDETPDGGLSASLVWRDHTTTTPGPITIVPMSRDGHGRWFAVLPPRPNLSIAEFYISATDGGKTRSWPAPTALGQVANCQYQVINEVPSTTAETLHLVLTATENAAFDALASSSDRQFNQTLIVTRGAEASIRYLCDMRIRGNSSRNYQFRPLRVSIPSDDPLDGLTTFMLNPRSPHLQYLGMRLFQAAGLRAPDAVPVDFRRNGVKYTTSSGATPDYGLWVRMEDIGGDFVKQHWTLPGADDGNVYKKGRNDFFWRATRPAPASPSGLLDGWSKQNNSALNDWSDLRTFFSVWQAAAAPHFPGSSALDVAGTGGGTVTNNGNWAGTAFTSGQLASVAAVSDLDQWARWFAVMTILQDNETNISNGQDDDYAAYIQPTVSGGVTNLLFQLLPHDLDTIFGLGDAPLAYNSRGLYDMTDNTYIFRTLLPLLGNNSTPGNAVFRGKYHTALRELLGTVFDTTTATSSPSPFSRMVDHHLGAWAPAANLTTIKNFANQRRAHLLGLLGTNALPAQAGTSLATLESPAGDIRLHEILADNVAAHPNNGLFPDVVEIINAGAAPRDVSGMGLTDDPLFPAKFEIPPGTVLAAGQILVLYADTDLAAPGLHLGFGLRAEGDTLSLHDTAANGRALLDRLTFGLQIPDHSVGRTGPTLDTWALCAPTIGATNAPVAALGPASGLRINEWLGNADFRVDDDFIELVNPSTLPVALGGMGLTDDPINRPFRGLLPPLSFMGPGAYVSFEPKGDSAAPGDASELPFKLGSTSGAVALFGSNGALVDRGDTITQFRDTSTGRVPDATGPFSRLNPPTPGFANSPLPDGETELLAFLRVTELMYHPLGANSEYVELRNLSDRSATPVTLDLGGLRFTKGITFTFPSPTLLAPGASLVIAHDAVRFAQQFPSVTPAGVYAGRLDDGGERLRLELASNALAIHDFTYDDAWHPSTDGDGPALQIVNPLGSLALWDVAEGWQASAPNPGALPPFGVDAGPDLTWALGSALPLDGAVYPGTNTLASLQVAWTQVAGPATGVLTTASFEDASVSFPVPGLYTLRLTAVAPGGVTNLDERVVLAHDTYATWAARMLTGQPAARAGMLDDPDGDGAHNLAEFTLGSDPLNPASRPTVSAFDTLTPYQVTWRRNRFADPAILVTPQICRGPDLSVWEDTPASIVAWQTGADGAFEEWQALDQTTPGPGFIRYFRLQISSP